MATLATLYDRLLGKSGAQVNTEARWLDAKSGKVTSNRLRPFPNEDVHFFVKQIDNSRVIREADPHAPKLCWSMIGGAGASAVLLIGMLLPTGYRLMAGYQIQDLAKQQELLERKMAELELEEAKLLSPGRLAGLARLQDFVDPSPERVIHMAEKPKQPAMAALRRPLKPLDQPAQSLPELPAAVLLATPAMPDAPPAAPPASENQQ